MTIDNEIPTLEGQTDPAESRRSAALQEVMKKSVLLDANGLDREKILQTIESARNGDKGAGILTVVRDTSGLSLARVIPLLVPESLILYSSKLNEVVARRYVHEMNADRTRLAFDRVIEPGALVRKLGSVPNYSPAEILVIFGGTQVKQDKMEGSTVEELKVIFDRAVRGVCRDQLTAQGVNSVLDLERFLPLVPNEFEPPILNGDRIGINFRAIDRPSGSAEVSLNLVAFSDDRYAIVSGHWFGYDEDGLSATKNAYWGLVTMDQIRDNDLPHVVGGAVSRLEWEGHSPGEDLLRLSADEKRRLVEMGFSSALDCYPD